MGARQSAETQEDEKNHYGSMDADSEIQRATEAPPRTLDEFLAEASSLPQQTPLQRTMVQWRYWMIFLCLGVANSSDAAEILCLSYILSEDNFKQSILLDEAWRGGLLAATVFGGMLIGGLLVGGSWGDVLGRKPTLLIGLATNSIGGFLSSFAWDVYSLSLLRFVAGIGIGSTVPPLFTLCSELAPPAQRGLCVTIAASFWMVGSIYVAVTAWWWLGVLDAGYWRLFAALCAIPSGLGWFLVWKKVPESPRFLLLQGSHHRALAVVEDLSTRLQYAGRSWTLEEARLHSPQEVSRNSYPEEGVIRNVMNDFFTSAFQLYIPGLVKITLPLQLVWFSLSFGSYGLYTWINKLFVAVHLDNVYLNALLFALSNLPGNLISAFFMDRIGRVKLLIASVASAAACLLVFAFVAFEDNVANQDTEVSDMHASTFWIVSASCGFQMFTIVAWNAIDVLTSELFPTTVRATGMGVCAASGRIGAMIAQFINGALISSPALLLVVAATTLLAGAVTPLMLPADRTGQPVSDQAQENSEQRDVEATFAGNKHVYSHVSDMT